MAKTEAEKNGAEEDVARVPEEVEHRGWTGFYEEDGKPILRDYQFKGFLKEAANILKEAIKIKALRSHVQTDVFVRPDYIFLADKPDGTLERPLRAMTQQGPRVSVMRSDMINPGREYELEIIRLQTGNVTDEALRTILTYGELSGLLQWRNGGYGRFKVNSFELQ